MDTGASAHMSFNQGNMISLTPCTSKSIMVGNGALLPINHIGHTFLPHSNQKFTLNDVLLSNHIVKKLVSVRKFTTDNSVSVSFDPFGFSVKDLKSDALLHRANSTSDLYPCLPSSVCTTSAKVFATVSLPTWHRRLGTPDLLFSVFCILDVLFLVVQLNCQFVMLVNLENIVVCLFLLLCLKLVVCLNLSILICAHLQLVV